MASLQSEKINDTYQVLSITMNGKKWEVMVSADLEEDGGLTVTIAKDSTVCTETSFGWNEKHENE